MRSRGLSGPSIKAAMKQLPQVFPGRAFDGVVSMSGIPRRDRRARWRSHPKTVRRDCWFLLGMKRPRKRGLGGRGQKRPRRGLVVEASGGVAGEVRPGGDGVLLGFDVARGTGVGRSGWGVGRDPGGGVDSDVADADASAVVLGSAGDPIGGITGAGLAAERGGEFGAGDGGQGSERRRDVAG